MKTDLWVTALLMTLWTTAVYSRSWLIEPHCMRNSKTCTVESVFIPDRYVIRAETPGADLWSYYTQNTSGILAIFLPLLLNLISRRPGRILPDALFVGQAMALNGIFVELSHFLSQRPRPFVYLTLPINGGDPSNYTSFYSGHTSYSAASLVALVLLLKSKNAPRPWTLFATVSAVILIPSTAVLRVLATRHFITDVVAGMAAGMTVALVVDYWHRGPRLASLR